MIKFNKNKDKIAIIAPSSLPHDGVEEAFTSATNLLEAKGFLYTYHPEIFSRKSLDFFAAKQNIRAEGVAQALEDPEVRIIWGFRGGYGSTEIINDCLPLKPVNEKLLIGYSDITTLHMLFNEKYQLPSLHASVLTSLLGEQGAMFAEIITLFESGAAQYDLAPLNEAAANIDLSINAKITGGNLAIFCNLIGTQLHPDTKGKILVLEDVSEKGYEIHRFFIHMHNAGLLQNLAAVILGDFIKGDKHVQAALDDICYRYLTSVPAYKLDGFGHGAVNHPIVMGSAGVIKDNKLSFDSPLCFIN